MAGEMTYEVIENYYRSYLRLHSHVVGLKTIRDQKAYEAIKCPSYQGRAYYCQMIKKATKGKSFKCELKNASCDTGARILGLKPYFEDQEDIEGWEATKLYAGRSQAIIEHETVRPIDYSTKGLLIGPLSKIEMAPEVVLIACNPYQAMRLMQAYTYHYGFKKDIKLSGQCGVCFEASALPIMSQDISLSLLCSGTRFVSKWAEDTMMVSIPFNRVEPVLDGLAQTAQSAEPKNIKHQILNRLHKVHLDPIVALTDTGAYFYK